MRMRGVVRSVVACAALLVAGAGVSNAVPVGYTLDVTTEYQFGAPAGALRYSGSPDTGFFIVTNNGTSTFNGMIGDIAVSNFSGDFSALNPIVLAPGQSVTIGVAPESSNVGGFNGPFGSPQPGVTIVINGMITKGVNSEAVNLSVNDSGIHSGVFRTNQFGVNLDNYVLQGGDPLGRDTGDGFETTQANGHFQFFEAAGTTVPLPAAAWSGFALLGLVAAARRMRSRK